MIRVLIAEDHPLMRQTLRCVMAREPRIEVIAEARDGREAVRLALELRPDVVLMDLSMPGLGGIEAAREIAAAGASGAAAGTRTKVIVVSLHADPYFATEALRAGAVGVVAKDDLMQELVGAILCAAGGKTYLTRQVAVLVDAAGHATADGQAGLAEHERQVLRLLADGASAPHIARRLQLNPQAVEECRRGLLQRLSLGSIADLSRLVRGTMGGEALDPNACDASSA